MFFGENSLTKLAEIYLIQGRVDGARAALERALELQPDDALTHYQMAQAQTVLQQWDEAFTAFEQGASARRGTVDYDEPGEQAMFDYIEHHYTSEWVDSRAPGNADPSPIFVLGQPRTGTTLVERVISSHSQVHSAGELQQFGLAVRRLGNYRNPKRFTRELFELLIVRG